MPFGSRGDHQPFIALANKLAERGLNVQMWVCGPQATAFCMANTSPDVRTCTVSGGPEVEDIISMQGPIRQSMASGSTVAYLKGVSSEMSKYTTNMWDSFLTLHEQFRADVILTNTLLWGAALLLRDKYNVKLIRVSFQPSFPSSFQSLFLFQAMGISLPCCNMPLHSLNCRLTSASSVFSMLGS